MMEAVALAVGFAVGIATFIFLDHISKRASDIEVVNLRQEVAWLQREREEAEPCEKCEC